MEIKQMTPTKVRVGEHNYYITPFPALTAANMTGELASTLAPLLGVLAPLATNNGGLGDVDVNDAAMAMSGLNISGDKIEKLVKRLLTTGFVVVELRDGIKDESERLTEDLVNELFCGDVIGLFGLCIHVIKINFAGFFEKLATQSGKATEAVAKIRTIL